MRNGRVAGPGRPMRVDVWVRCGCKAWLAGWLCWTGGVLCGGLPRAAGVLCQWGLLCIWPGHDRFSSAWWCGSKSA